MSAGPATLEALPAPRLLWGLRQPLAGLWLRPWFDRVALRFIARTYLPLSRGWALAAEPGQSAERLAAALGIDPSPDLAAALAAVDAARRTHEQAEARWRQVLFGGLGNAAAGIAAERARAEAAHRFMAGRRHLAPWRRHLPPLRWHIAPPAPPPPLAAAPISLAGAEPRRSACLPGGNGRESWLAFPSPVLGDEVLARVTEPAAGRAGATLIHLHGICMESEMWRPTLEPPVALVRAGWRVVRPEGPWHGRRRLPGFYGGEPVMARGPEGFRALFEAWLAEVATLVAWARRQGGPVALSGISLGALTAQLYASRARDWPAALAPDALLLLTTTGDLLEAVVGGALARRLGAPAALARAGWDEAALAAWLAPLEPGESAVPAARTIMLLGTADRVTPYAGGLALARRWGLPAANVFRPRRGHFTAALALAADPAPLRRLDQVLPAETGQRRSST